MSPIIIQSDTSALLTQPIDVMVEEVTSIVGGSGDDEVRNLAIRCLDRAADRMNGSGVYLFMQKEVDYTSFTAGQSSVTLPSDWGWPVDAGSVYDTDQTTITREVQWVPYNQYLRSTSDLTTQGVPSIFSILSEDDNKAYFWPTISTGDVGQITLVYLARVDRVSETNLPVFTNETREALISGAQAFIMRYRNSTNPGIWRPYFEDFTNEIYKAKAASTRRQQAERSFARPDEVSNAYFRRPFKPVYLAFGS